MGVALKQVVNGVRSRQRSGDLVGRSKSGANIPTSIPGNLGMIFKVQQKLFFHLATERLPRGASLTSFPAGNPARNAFSRDFEQIHTAYPSLGHELVPHIA